MFPHDFFIYPLALLVRFCYSVIPPVWDILRRLCIAPHRLSPNGWGVLSSLAVLMGLEELAYLYEMQRDADGTISFPRESGRYLVPLKLCTAALRPHISHPTESLMGKLRTHFMALLQDLSFQCGFHGSSYRSDHLAFHDPNRIVALGPLSRD